MARLPRIVVPGIPHHVTQRGNRRERVFFQDADYELYRGWLATACENAGVAIWAYCLMPNHVHLILTPGDNLGMSKALGEVHRQYAGFLNARRRQTGHVFQGRFHSVAMDESHLLAAVRYVAFNPVKAGLVADAGAWRWSSAAAHLRGQSDGVVQVQPVLDRIPRFAEYLGQSSDGALEAALSAGHSIGRPLMEEAAIREIEERLNLRILPAKRGPKPATGGNDARQIKLV